jgi:N-acetylmuramoyl-L-alanine amidase
MTEYHAFYEIEPQTPAAIIETGFMDADRRLLTKHPDRIAQGIVDGLLCFLAP